MLILFRNYYSRKLNLDGIKTIMAGEKALEGTRSIGDNSDTKMDI